jgi:hypothetical protein
MRASIFALTFLLALTTHFTSAAPIQCPQDIKTSDTLKEKISGWNEFLDDWNNFHHPNNVTFYSGHPKEHASLVPDNENTKGNKLIWTFGKDTIWLGCNYTNTNIQLIQQLSGKTNRCTVTYEANFSKVIGIDCI